MTDARLPGRWLLNPVMDSLSDRAWRTFTGSLMWSAEQATDGVLTDRSLRLLHPDGVDPLTLEELLRAGLWERTESGIVSVANWSETQSTSEQLARGREMNKQRQQRHRARAQEKAATASPDPVTGDVTRDRTGDVTRVSPRQGKDRQGKARQGLKELDDRGSNAIVPGENPASGKIPTSENLADSREMEPSPSPSVDAFDADGEPIWAEVF